MGGVFLGGLEQLGLPYIFRNIVDGEVLHLRNLDLGLGHSSSAILLHQFLPIQAAEGSTHTGSISTTLASLGCVHSMTHTRKISRQVK